MHQPGRPRSPLVMFSLKGDYIIRLPLDVVLTYFVLMFLVFLSMVHRLGADYSKTATFSLTAASNDFELTRLQSPSLAYNWGAAFAGVIAPIIKVRTHLALVNVALWFQRHWSWEEGIQHAASAHPVHR